MLTNGYSVDKISKQLNIYPKSVLKIETLFVKKRHEVKTKLGSKNCSYWTNEEEMSIQEYRAEDLRGEEREILKKLK